MSCCFQTSKFVLLPGLLAAGLPQYQHDGAKNDVHDPGPQVYYFRFTPGGMDDKRGDQQKDSYHKEEQPYDETEIKNVFHLSNFTGGAHIPHCSIYKNIRFRMAVSTNTITPRTTGRLYHTAFSAFGRGVRL